MSDSTDVVDWKNYAAGRVTEVKEAEQSPIVTLSTAQGQMSIDGNEVPNNEIEVVILAMGTERTYYDRPYDPDDRDPPNCYSQIVGKDDTFNPTMIPAENVPEPMADSCAECEFSKMGSANIGKGPACKTRRKLVCAPASMVDNPDSLGKSILLVNVPPTSGAGFGKYVGRLSGQGVPPEFAITKISLKRDPKTQYKLEFEAAEQITNEAALQAIATKRHTFDELTIREYNYEDTDAEPEPEKGKGKRKY